LLLLPWWFGWSDLLGQTLVAEKKPRICAAFVFGGSTRRNRGPKDYEQGYIARAETKKDAIGVFFDLVKQVRTPLANRVAQLRLSRLGSAQSHPVSRFDSTIDVIR